MIKEVFTIAYIFDEDSDNGNAFHKEVLRTPQNIYNDEPIIQYNNRNYLNSIYDYKNNNYPQESQARII